MSRVVLPALGRPTMPMSASSLSSSDMVFVVAFSPGCAYLGVCIVGVLNVVLPNPPFPPFSRVFVWLCFVISAIVWFVLVSFAIVPSGTCIVVFVPFCPALFFFFSWVSVLCFDVFFVFEVY